MDSQTHTFSPYLSDIMFRCLSETAVCHAGKSLPRSLDCYAFQEIKVCVFPNRVIVYFTTRGHLFLRYLASY